MTSTPGCSSLSEVGTRFGLTALALSQSIKSADLCELLTRVEEPTNNQRADWAMHGLLAFAEITGLRNERNQEDLDIIVGDFLADLMHLCDSEEIDIESMMQRADSHYREEVEMEEDAEDEQD